MSIQKIEEVILFQIDKTSKVAKQHSQREFDRLGLGITIEQWVLLKIIDESADISQRMLASNSMRDPASITRTLNLLEKKNLIRRSPSEENKRKYHLTLTEEGKQFISKNLEVIQAMRNKSISGFSEEELKSLMEMLIKIQKNMSIE